MNHNYPYLPEGKNIEYVPVSNKFMEEAQSIRNSFSTDAGHPTGAVVVLNGRVIGRGANKSAFKSKILIDFHKKYICIRRILKIKSGEKYWLCPGCASSIHHAETRAVKDAFHKNGSAKDADLYLYGHWWCCKPCWDSMIKHGIKKVYLVDDADKLFKK